MLDSQEIEVAEEVVACDGGLENGHPRVFLHIEHDSGKVVCPYCSKIYKVSH